MYIFTYFFIYIFIYLFIYSFIYLFIYFLICTNINLITNRLRKYERDLYSMVWRVKYDDVTLTNTKAFGSVVSMYYITPAM